MCRVRILRIRRVERTRAHLPACHIKVCACNYVISLARILDIYSIQGPPFSTSASVHADNCLFNWIELIAGRTRQLNALMSIKNVM